MPSKFSDRPPGLRLPLWRAGELRWHWHKPIGVQEETIQEATLFFFGSEGTCDKTLEQTLRDQPLHTLAEVEALSKRADSRRMEEAEAASASGSHVDSVTGKNVVMSKCDRVVDPLGANHMARKEVEVPLEAATPPHVVTSVAVGSTTVVVTGVAGWSPGHKFINAKSVTPARGLQLGLSAYTGRPENWEDREDHHAGKPKKTEEDQ
ncbi:Inner membrane protein YohK [Frankliniella fusca]|uniref:Inner membrane protein YohK n=1 Tax=Frankliniella fusca TaxID=407009 RepID=A0AAE1LLQ4_9NEOP|nr:Inner membrane protein YohK [Frankliniella fusca]